MRHAACGRLAAGEGRRCFVAAMGGMGSMGRLDGHHRWRARSSSATLCRRLRGVEKHRRLQSLLWHGLGPAGHPPLARSPASVLALDPRSSATSWRPRNRDEIDELTMIDLHHGSRPQCPSYHPSPGARLASSSSTHPSPCPPILLPTD
jgi:hypothetical protein